VTGGVGTDEVVKVPPDESATVPSASGKLIVRLAVGVNQLRVALFPPLVLISDSAAKANGTAVSLMRGVISPSPLTFMVRYCS
jgi:hypothetical protein